jgi:hypothetical protein
VRVGESLAMRIVRRYAHTHTHTHTHTHAHTHALFTSHAPQISNTSSEATIYYYNGTTTLFTSTDSGATFTPTYERLNPWNTPFFGVAVPPRGAAAAGDLWVFSGWQLFHR